MYPLKYDLNELLKLHEEGWLKMSRYKDQLYIFCYSPACQYEKHWTPITLAMRGMVLGRQGQVIGQCLPKFFNLCEVDETRPENLPALPYEIFQKQDGCVDRLTPISLWGGGSKFIHEIVNSQEEFTVVGFRDGKFVPSKVLAKANNGFKTNWIKVGYDLHGVTYTEKGLSGKTDRKMVVTTNHLFYTDKGYTPIGELKVGDSIKTLDFVPNKDLTYLLSCFLLGDGSISSSAVQPSSKFSVGHKQDHLEYLRYKKDLLSYFGCQEDTTISGFGTKMSRIYTQNYNSLTRFKQNWYKPGAGRTLPESLDWMDDFAVALWYMDDGSLSKNTTQYQKDRAQFSTYRFPLDDVTRLKEKLESLFNISISIQKDKRNKGFGCVLRVNAGRHGEIDQFWSRVAPYVLPCMRYKLPDEYKNIPFVDMRGKLQAAMERQLVDCKITSIETTKKHKITAYDLQTETGNYVANGILVHNSYIQSFYNPYEKRWQHSSKCSFDNEYIDAAYRFLPASVMEAKMDKFESLISEVRFDEDPMRRVTDAPSGLYAITSWRKFSTQIEENPFIHTQVLAHNLGINQVEEFDDSLQEKLESFNGEEDTEGYVVRFRNGFRTKLKTAWYLRLNRAIDDFDKSRARDTVKTYLTNYDHSLEWIKYLPDELWEEAKEIATRLLEEFESKVGVVDKLFETHYSKDRKTFALTVKDLPESPYLFSKFNGKDYKSMIWEKL